MKMPKPELIIPYARQTEVTAEDLERRVIDRRSIPHTLQVMLEK